MISVIGVNICFYCGLVVLGFLYVFVFFLFILLRNEDLFVGLGVF